MTEKCFTITLSDNLVVVRADGTISRNANGSQYIDIELDDWVANEDDAFYIGLKYYDGYDLLEDIGPLFVPYDSELKRYVTPAPPELLNRPGKWQYSIERRFDIEGAGDEICYRSITSAINYLDVIDSAISSVTGNYVKETELIAAVRVIEKAERTATDAAAGAINAERTASGAAQTATDAAENAVRAADDAQTCANDVAIGVSYAQASASNAATSAGAADSSARVAASQAALAESSAKQSESLLKQTTVQAERAGQLLEQFASYGIKINTEYSSYGELPVPGNPNSIYFIPNGNGGANGFDEWVWLANKNSYEKIGNTEVDLSNYVKKSGDRMEGALAVSRLTTPNDSVICKYNARMFAIDFGDVNNSILLYGRDERPLYSTLEEGSEVTKDLAFFDDVPEITLNGTTTKAAAFYAPTVQGNPGQIPVWTSDEENPIVWENAPEAAVIDTALSTSSPNPVQNKAVTSELSKKADLSGATFTGEVSALTVKGTDGVYDGEDRVFSAKNLPDAMSYLETANSDASRVVWFADNRNDAKPVKSKSFMYNPATGGLIVGGVENPFVKKAGDTMAGSLTVTGKFTGNGGVYDGTYRVYSQNNPPPQLATSRTIEGMPFDGSADITHYATCSTSAGTAAKTVTKTGFVLETGARITVKFIYANTVDTPTLNVSSTGAKSIKGTEPEYMYIFAKWIAGTVMEFVYDGTYWVCVGGYPLQGMPVGYVYVSHENTSPAILFGGSWTPIKGRTLIGCGDNLDTPGYMGEYSSTKTYYANDIVTHNSKYYLCTVTYTKGNTPSSTNGSWTEYKGGAQGGSSRITLSNSNLPANMGSFEALGWNNSITATGIVSSQHLAKDRTAPTSDAQFGTAKYTLSGGDEPINKMPPYQLVYMWQRTA